MIEKKMLRLTVRPETLSFSNKWVLYAHLHCGSTTYFNSYIKVSEIKTIADFWQTINNLPTAYDLYYNSIFMDGKRVVAYSLFKDDILPEWEDPVNTKGCEWGCRDNISEKVFSSMWSSLILAAVNDELDDVVGIRCINKTNKIRSLFKIEVWMSCSDYEDALKVKENMKIMIKTCETFTLMYHEDKKTQAIEYTRKKNKKSQRF